MSILFADMSITDYKEFRCLSHQARGIYCLDLLDEKYTMGLKAPNLEFSKLHFSMK